MINPPPPDSVNTMRNRTADFAALQEQIRADYVWSSAIRYVFSIPCALVFLVQEGEFRSPFVIVGHFRGNNQQKVKTDVTLGIRKNPVVILMMIRQMWQPLYRADRWIRDATTEKMQGLGVTFGELANKTTLTPSELKQHDWAFERAAF